MPTILRTRSNHVQGRRLGCRTGADVVASSVVPTVPARDIVEHRHAEAHFVLVTAGRYCSDADGASAAGGLQCIFNPPGTQHRDCFAAGQDLPRAHFYSLWIAPAAWQHLTASLELPGWACVLDGDATRGLAAGARGLFASPGANEMDIDCLAAEFTAAFATMAARHARDAGRIQPPWLSRVREQLRDTAVSSDASLRLGDLAAAQGVHPVYLARAFRRHYRCSPGEYLRRCRLERAAALIASTRQPLAAIALQCGYFDQAHLSRAFAASYGISPGQYRLSLA
ncbi:MAG: helix-turn-helix transcriptional regulator [Betaproteobacteria bacterium]|nr:helix-turn-helix transcriptional regulator [Betaproteobacteria bacterium]